MMKRLAILFALLTATAYPQALPAFVGAQGGGAVAVGGRGGVVMEVTNLNDSGAGSLRACLQASGARTCVFRVCGLISFLSRAQVSSPFLTVAGQSAPCSNGGVTIGGANQKGEQIFISTHDVVVRYITYDGNNPNTPTGPDTGTVCCEMASGDIYNTIWDHISARWVGNKVFPLVSNVAGKGIHNMNIQWSLMYEPNVLHAVGIGTVYVSEGSGMATTDDDAHHNMFVTTDHRLPLNQSGRNVRWVNNIVYNWGMFAGLSMGGVQTDYIGNKYLDGAGCINSKGCLNYQNGHVFLGEPGNADDAPGDWPNGDNLGNPTLYLLNNTGRTGIQRNSVMFTPSHVVNAEFSAMTGYGTEAGDCAVQNKPSCKGTAMPPAWMRSSPLPSQPFPITADPVENLDNVLLPTIGNSQHLDCLGNWVSHRDSQDLRILNIYKNKQASDLFYGQFASPAIPNGTPCVTSLHDGLPDQWKVAKGLSTTDPNLYKSKAPSGYTYLEEYLNGGGGGPTPPPATCTTFAVNCQVKANATVNVRVTPGGALVGTQPTGATGSTIAGPQTANGIPWWNVAFTSGANGWVGQDGLTLTGVTPPPVITVSTSCVPLTVQVGGTAICTATVTGSNNTAVTWSSTGGTISAGGSLTNLTTAGTITVTATSVADTSKKGLASVVVTSPTPPPTTNFQLNCTCDSTGKITCTGQMPQ